MILFLLMPSKNLIRYTRKDGEMLNQEKRALYDSLLESVSNLIP